MSALLAGPKGKAKGKHGVQAQELRTKGSKRKRSIVAGVQPLFSAGQHGNGTTRSELFGAPGVKFEVRQNRASDQHSQDMIREPFEAQSFVAIGSKANFPILSRILSAKSLEHFSRVFLG